MSLKKQQQQEERFLEMCLADRRWVDRSPLFPAYLDLDGDEQFKPEADLNPRFELKQLDQEYREKVDLLLATDKPSPKEFCFVDSEGRLDLEKIKALNPNRENTDLHNIRSIAESLDHLTLLNGKKVFDRNFDNILKDRTMHVSSETVDQLRDVLKSAEDLNKSKYETLACLRLFEEQQRELLALQQATHIDIE